jgi:hypothetical protein
MRGWQGQQQPRKMANGRIRTLAKKIKPKGRSPGCGLQLGGAENDLLAIRLQSSTTLVSAARTSNSRSRCLVPLSALFGLKTHAMRVILF